MCLLLLWATQDHYYRLHFTRLCSRNRNVQKQHKRQKKEYISHAIEIEQGMLAYVWIGLELSLLFVVVMMSTALFLFYDEPL